MEYCDSIRLHPEPPRYFLFRGKATALITTTEHYGAVTNTAFDYAAYLGMLAEHGFNLTRLVLTLREQASEFKGTLGWQNTCCPTAEHACTPWARSDAPGAADGGCLFDLDRWNEAFFVRLRAFCERAGELGIVVEVTFFSQLYSGKADSPWSLCPLNPVNNVQREGATAFNRYTGDENPVLFARQQALVRRVVAELNGLDNVYYEICNEPPYPEPDAPDPMPEEHPAALGEPAISRWQNRLAAVVREAEAGSKRHLIAVGDPHENIDLSLFSVLNFHYRAWAEHGLRAFGGSAKALGFDETLTGIVAWNRELDFEARRKEAWEFLLRGFAVYDYLDFTIATGDPRGKGAVDFPGGHRYNGSTLRRWLSGLQAFLREFDLPALTPVDGLLDPPPATCDAWALGDGYSQWAFYINGAGLARVALALPAGRFRLRWYDPARCEWIGEQTLHSCGSTIPCPVPAYGTDIAGIVRFLHK